MNNLQIFKGHKVEILNIDGKVLFNPYDVGVCLELEKSSVRRAIQKMNSNQAFLLKNSNVQDMNIRKLHNTGEKFLTESGVYKLIFKSNKPKAEEFANWVTDEVLPQIRETGSYGVSNQNDNQIIEMLATTQQNMLIMMNTLAKTVDNLAKNTNRLEVKENSELEQLKNNQFNLQKLKVQTLPKEIIDIVDELLSSENRNFSYISRYLYDKGYNVSNVAVSKYYHKIFKGEK